MYDIIFEKAKIEQGFMKRKLSERFLKKCYKKFFRIHKKTSVLFFDKV